MSTESKIQNPKSKIVVGLVGQVCSGKSTVAEAFRKRGARVYDADMSVHEIYQQPDTIEDVVRLFGPTVQDEGGNISRKALGKIVFADAEKLKVLTSQVIFPRTVVKMKEAIESLRGSDAPALVLNAPTLFEAGHEALCDRILFLTAPLQRRKEWGQARGWTEEELALRESRLGDPAAKQLKADAVIDNAGTLEELDRAIDELFERWRS